MKKSKLVHIIEKHCCSLQKQQQLLMRGYDIEASHDFRVEIKKLRAFLRMLNHKNGLKNGLQISKHLRLFYRSVGELRSLQLQQEMVQTICKELHYPEPAEYLSLLHNKEIKAQKKIRENAKATSLHNLGHRLKNSLPQTFTDKDVRHYVEEKRVQLQGFLTVLLLADETLHSIRKLLKDLLYVWLWVEAVLLDMLPGSAGRKAYCLQLTDELGTFQDYCTALTFFHPNLTNQLSLEEQERVQSIQQEFIRRKELQKRSIMETLLTLRLDLRANRYRGPLSPVSVSLSHR
jgi:CHAD domain-containing protein